MPIALPSGGSNDDTPDFGPASGPYADVVKSLLNGETWPPDPTGCIKRISPIGLVDSIGPGTARAPSVVVVWSQESRIRPQATFNLLAVPSRLAARLVADPLPHGCRDFTESGRRYELSAEPIKIGQAGQLITMTFSRNGAGSVQTFKVIFYARGYLAIIQAMGHGVTRDIAMQYGKLVSERAELQLI